MSAEPKWIDFLEQLRKPKTRVWLVTSKDHLLTLGRIAWYSRFCCYSFFPNPETVYEKACLRDIAEFCEQRSREHLRVRMK